MPSLNPFSQAPIVKEEKFQCPSKRELHVDFKTHLNFEDNAILVGTSRPTSESSSKELNLGWNQT